VISVNRESEISMTKKHLGDESVDVSIDEPVAVEVTESGKRVRLPPTRTLAVARIVRILDSMPESERARAVAAIVALYGAA
jgi:hypothetical protein